MKPNTNTFNLLCQQTGEESKIEFIELILSFFLIREWKEALLGSWVYCRGSTETLFSNQSVLTTDYLIQAHDCLIKVVQGIYFDVEVDTLNKGKTYIPALRKLAPFVDARYFLRVEDRSPKDSLLLPKQITFTKLLNKYVNKANFL